MQVIKANYVLREKNHIQQNTTLDSFNDVKPSQAPNKLFFS